MKKKKAKQVCFYFETCFLISPTVLFLSQTAWQCQLTVTHTRPIEQVGHWSRLSDFSVSQSWLYFLAELATLKGDSRICLAQKWANYGPGAKCSPVELFHLAHRPWDNSIALKVSITSWFYFNFVLVNFLPLSGSQKYSDARAPLTTVASSVSKFAHLCFNVAFASDTWTHTTQ